jgi:ParB family chromosome partitioning protein
MTKRKSLGRGLNALIPSEPEHQTSSGTRTVAVLDISPNPRQPRTIMDEAALAELAASIREHGLIQPLIVSMEGDKFVLIAGERRWRAAQLAGLATVPVVVKETTPQEMLELAIIENIQRADLNALEEALAYRQLMDEFGLTQEEVADRVGKARSTVANLVRLLQLPADVQQSVLDGRLSGAHAREILRLPTAEQQIQAKNQMVRLGLNRRQAAALVDSLLAEKKPQPKPRKSLSPEMLALQEQFERTLGTRVAIVDEGDKGGRVVIYFYSDEELQAIYESIAPEA